PDLQSADDPRLPHARPRCRLAGSPTDPAMRAPTRAATPRSGNTPVTSARHRSHSPGGAGAEVSGQLRRPDAARARTKRSAVPEYRRSARIWAAPERVRRGGIPEGHGGAGGLLIRVGAFIILSAMPPRLVTALEIGAGLVLTATLLTLLTLVAAFQLGRLVRTSRGGRSRGGRSPSAGAGACRIGGRVPNRRPPDGSRKEPEPGGGPLPGRHA